MALKSPSGRGVCSMVPDSMATVSGCCSQIAAIRPIISARAPMMMSRKLRRGEVFEDMSWRVQGERWGVGVHYSTGRVRHCVARALAYRRTLVLPFERMNILVIDSDREIGRPPRMERVCQYV